MDRKIVKSFNDCFRELVWCLNTIKQATGGGKESLFRYKVAELLRYISDFPKKHTICGNPVVVNDIESIYVHIAISRQHKDKRIMETYEFKGTVTSPLDFLDLLETIEEWLAYTNYRYTLEHYKFDVSSKTLESNLFRY